MSTTSSLRCIINILIVYGACGISNAASQSVDSTAVYLFPHETPVTYLAVWKIMRGDSAEWRSPFYNDSRWNTGTAGTLWAHDTATGRGIQWYRQTIFIPERLDSLRACALFCRAAVCASEVYWDGILISQNGRIGAGRDSEVPGTSARFTIIPGQLVLPGRHVAALRVGNAGTFSGFLEAPLQIGYFDEILGHLHRSQTLLLLCAGVFLIAALFHFGLTPGRVRGPASALFGVLCLSSAAYLLIDALVHYFPTSLARYYAIALVNDGPWFCMMVLLPVFFLYEFEVPFRMRISAGIAAAALACIVPPRLIMFGVLPTAWLPAFELANLLYMYAVALFSALVSLAHLARRTSGSLLSLAGCAALLAGIHVSFWYQVEYAWALGFTALIILLTVSLSRQMAEQNRKRQESELRNARLELELLKKHMQPHFLLNSLNSIIAWLEEDPSAAIRLVTALAEELRLIVQFSKEKLVPVNEELRLCGLHLEVMGLRHDRNYSLAADAVPRSEYIPPLVFHTLVENGLTHGYAGKQGGTFVFRREAARGRLRYTMFNDGAPGSNGPDAHEGTGIRYVKTRLQEAYPGSWRFWAGPVEHGWEAGIELAVGTHNRLQKHAS